MDHHQNKKFLLYYLKCPIDNSIRYVGITTNELNKRLMSHIRKPTNYIMRNWFKMLKSVDKKPTIVLVKECKDYNDLLESEIQEIKKLRDLKIEIYNIADGGNINPMLGKTHTPEARKKISGRKKGIKMSEEQKKIHKERLKKLWEDPVWSLITRQKMRINKNGVYYKVGEKNPNWKGGISTEKSFCSCGNEKSRKSKTCFSCRNLNGINNPFFGKTHTAETLSKKNETFQKKGISFKGKNNPNFKYDIKLDDLYRYYIIENKNIKEIANIYKCSYNTIKNILNKNNIKKINNKYNLDLNKIIEYKNLGYNLVKIGEIFGCNNKIIHKYLKNKLYVK